jgi:hypothetical protein
MIGILRKVRHWWRSSITGKFVSKAFAKANPDTTQEERKR